MIRMVSHMAKRQLSWTLFSIHTFFRCCELFDSFSLDYSRGCSTHKTGRLTYPIVQSDSLFSVGGLVTFK